STDAPLPPPSPERSVWAATVAPWVMVWRRFMFAAQVGGPSADGAGDDVPPEIVPPVAVTAARPPER
ncbi:hypothetical protein, partial [Enterobacter hormaechei]|uniref:hypothetical protein n=1 Tax=Enterobacter hormaechei TaxID=158836 RepID=UPI001953D253